MELKIKGQCVLDCSHQGRCDDDVAAWLQDERIRKQFAAIDDQTLIAHLREFGAWDAAELSDRDANEARTLWTCCTNLAEEHAKISATRYYYAWLGI